LRERPPEGIESMQVCCGPCRGWGRLFFPFRSVVPWGIGIGRRERSAADQGLGTPLEGRAKGRGAGASAGGAVAGGGCRSRSGGSSPRGRPNARSAWSPPAGLAARTGCNDCYVSRTPQWPAARPPRSERRETRVGHVKGAKSTGSTHSPSGNGHRRLAAELQFGGSCKGGHALPSTRRTRPPRAMPAQCITQGAGHRVEGAQGGGGPIKQLFLWRRPANRSLLRVYGMGSEAAFSRCASADEECR
jgi:hypothetical protein